MKPIIVGSAIGRPGEKVSGFITVPDASDPGTQIPVTVVTGTRDGPVLVLTAGVHGGEPAPILALQRVRAEIDPQQLSGTVIIVQIVNPPSFHHRTIYYGPWDHKNLNRMFPGKLDGTASERIAYAITTQVIELCDYMVDLHSGDGNEALLPHVYLSQMGADATVDARAKEMALAFGVDHIVIDRNRPRDDSIPDFCATAATRRGKPTILTEVGEVGVPTAEAVGTNARGAMSVMRHLKMLPGAPDTVTHPRWVDPVAALRSPGTGLWQPAVRPDQVVKTGDVLGRLTGYFGEPLAEVMSPMDGTVIWVIVSPAMRTGESVAMIGKVSD